MANMFLNASACNSDAESIDVPVEVEITVESAAAGGPSKPVFDHSLYCRKFCQLDMKLKLSKCDNNCALLHKPTFCKNGKACKFQKSCIFGHIEEQCIPPFPKFVHTEESAAKFKKDCEANHANQLAKNSAASASARVPARVPPAPRAPAPAAPPAAPISVPLTVEEMTALVKELFAKIRVEHKNSHKAATQFMIGVLDEC